MNLVGGGTPEKLGFGVLWLIAGLAFALRSQVSRGFIVSAVFTGIAVVAGWFFTYRLSQVSFAPATLKSLTFSGPSAELLMTVLNSPQVRPDFDLGIVLASSSVPSLRPQPTANCSWRDSRTASACAAICSAPC
jgi:hypothetical protein